MKKSIIFVIIICIAQIHVGCQKFLDKKPIDNQRELVELSDFQAVLDVANILNNIGSSTRMEGSSDDLFIPDHLYEALSEQPREIYTWRNFEYRWANEWSHQYRAIAQANIVLDGIALMKNEDSDQPAWQNVKGSALFFRAYHYLVLAWLYTLAYDEASFDVDLGLPLRLTSDFDEAVDRSSVKDTYSRIIEDARASAELLPDFPDHVRRPSKAAAYALLARTYLSMRQYEEAYLYANESLLINNRMLNYAHDVPDFSSNAPFGEYNKEIIFYSQVAAGQLNSSNYSRVDSSLINAYEEGDLRKKAFFSADGSHFVYKGSYSGQTNMLFTGLTTAELLLIRSESLARLERIQEARTDISQLLSNRYEAELDFSVPSDQERLLDFILMERRKELLMRGIRWSDIKRLNKEGKNIVPKRIIDGEVFELPPHDNRYALPLPQDIILISGMQQNPQ